MLMLSMAGVWSVGRSLRAADSPDLPKPAVDLPAPSDGETSRTAVLAGGCFWSIEATFEQVRGVTDVVSGYAGGTKATANYDQYHDSNHAECVRITYDPRQITYGELLQILLTISDPTQKDGQGNDRGSGYRSAVFYENDDQKRVAQAYVQQLKDSKVFGERQVYTKIEPLGDGFFSAENYHQNFVANNPDNAYGQMTCESKMGKLQAHFPEKMKRAATTRSSK